METYLLQRDEASLEGVIASEIAAFGVVGPFLDVGAGTGAWVASVSRSGSLAVGVDRSERLLREARARHGLHRLAVADGCALPFASGCFRWVQLQEVIEHLDRDAGRMLLREAHRTLRPGGTLRLTTPNRLRYAVPSRRLARLAGLFGWSDDRAHRYEYWPWEIRAVVAREGFAVQAFRYRGRNRYVPWEPFSGGVEILARRP